jgi:hypothetical protein
VSARKKPRTIQIVPKDRPLPETASLFSSSELGPSSGDRPLEEKENAPPDAADKIRMAKQKPQNNGGRARRKLHTLKNATGYRVDEDTWNGPARVPVLVSIFCMDTRTYWRRVDDLSVPNPMMELARSAPEEPPRGTQWSDATSPRG